MAESCATAWSRNFPQRPELGVAPTVGIDRLVFEVQQLQRDVLAALVLVMHLEPVWLGPIGANPFVSSSEQPCLEPGCVQILGQRPAHTRLPRTLLRSVRRALGTGMRIPYTSSVAGWAGSARSDGEA